MESFVQPCGERADGGPCALPYGHEEGHKAYVDVLIDSLPDPDIIGESEYRAMHEVLVTGLGSASEEGLSDRALHSRAASILAMFELNVMQLRTQWLGIEG